MQKLQQTSAPDAPNFTNESPCSTRCSYNPTKATLHKARDEQEKRRRAREHIREKYEASVQRTLASKESHPLTRVRAVPDMDSWASTLGVAIDSSKATKGGCRRVELEDAGRLAASGSCTHLSAAASCGEDRTTSHQSSMSSFDRRRCVRFANEGGCSHVQEVSALDGLLSDVHDRLCCLEEGTVWAGSSSASTSSKPGQGGARECDVLVSAGRINTKGGGRWEAHVDNLETRDKIFLQEFKRFTQMTNSQILMSRIWRGHRVLKQYSRWKRRRLWNLKTHVRAWHVTTKAGRHYARNLERLILWHWSNMVKEKRCTRVMYIRCMGSAASGGRIWRDAVVQFFDEEGQLSDDSSPEVAWKRACVKRRILKVLLEGWRVRANANRKAAAQGAFCISKAARLQPASRMLWAPEWVNLLFHMWSRMVKFLRALKEENNLPTFPAETGHNFLPEWDSWVASRGKRILLKRETVHRGRQVLLHNTFRRWAGFARCSTAQDERFEGEPQVLLHDTFRRWKEFTRWSTAQDERFEGQPQYMHGWRAYQAFIAWANLSRERGKTLRRVARCWKGWRHFSSQRKRTKSLREKVGSHLKLLRTGLIFDEMKAIARDGKIMAAFAVSKLILRQKRFGGRTLSYVATEQSAEIFSLVAWQAWRRFVAKRRRWKWLLYQHSKVEALHTKQAILKAWSFATGQRCPKATTITLSASIPFSTWDRFIQSYVDRGVFPQKQLAKDIVNHSVMQQNTSHWLLSDGPDSDCRDSEASSTVRIPADGGREGDMDLRSCGSGACSGDGGGGGDSRKTTNQLAVATTDWRALTPALFKAVDECDTVGVSNLLRRGAHVNTIYPPPNGIGGGASTDDHGAQGIRVAKESTLGLRETLDLPATIMVPASDGTFQMRGTTPLHVAACHLSADFLPIVILLLHAGALVDALDSGGMTPLQLCTSPQTAALLHFHAKRLHAFDFSSRELRWGREVLTTEHRVVGGAALWRYITRNAICAGLDQLNVALRAKNKRVENTQKTTHIRPFSSGTAVQTGEIPGHFISKSNHQENERAVNKGSGSVSLEERHKEELIRVKMERLHGAKIIVEREHFLNCGGSAIGGVGNRRGEEEMSKLFHALDHEIAERDKNIPPAEARESRQSSASPDHDQGVSVVSGKARTLDEVRKAFSCRRTEAATWFGAFQDSLSRAGLLDSVRYTNHSNSRVACENEESTNTLLAILGRVESVTARAASRCGEKRGRGNVGSGSPMSVLGGPRVHEINQSSMDAFSMAEVSECWRVLENILDQSAKVAADQRATEKGLLERVPQSRQQRASQQKRVRMRHRVGGKSPLATRRRAKNRKKDISEPPASLVSSTTEAAETTGLKMNMDGIEKIERSERGTREVGKLEMSTKEQNLVVDVIPTSAHQRCYSVTVAIRGTYEQQVLARAVRTLAVWKTGNGNEWEWGESKTENTTLEQDIISRTSIPWRGGQNERVLALMQEERRKMLTKRDMLSSQAQGLGYSSASIVKELKQFRSRERELGTTIRKVAVKYRENEAKFLKDVRRWQEKIEQAQTNVRSIARKRVRIVDEIAELKRVLANGDNLEQPTATERSKRKKKQEERTLETLKRDIDAKQELISKLNGVEKRSRKTMETAEQQVKTGWDFLARVKALLASYLSYSMVKMETIEGEYRQCAEQHKCAKDRQKSVDMQLGALSRRLQELEEAISKSILQNAGVVLNKPKHPDYSATSQIMANGGARVSSQNAAEDLATPPNTNDNNWATEDMSISHRTALKETKDQRLKQESLTLRHGFAVSRRQWAGEKLDENGIGDQASGIVHGGGRHTLLDHGKEPIVIAHVRKTSVGERASPTHGNEEERLLGDLHRRQRPGSRPCSTRNQAESASTIFDRRPPWIHPMYSMFAPRVPASAQKIHPMTAMMSSHHRRSTTCSSSRGKSGDKGVDKNTRGHRLVRGMPRPDLFLAPPSAPSCPGGGGRGRDARERCNSAPEVLLQPGQTRSHEVYEKAPANDDDIWSWGGHNNGSQESLQEPFGFFPPVVTSEEETEAFGTLNGRPWAFGLFRDEEVVESERTNWSSNEGRSSGGRDQGVLVAAVTQTNPSEINKLHGRYSKTHGELAQDDGSFPDNANAGNKDVTYSASLQKDRRVSFEDEKDSNKNTRRSARSLSNLIDSVYNPNENEAVARIGKRMGKVERSRYATELVTMAQEFMFNETRPDGLRPMTGTPMENGRISGGSGGVYAGLSGLKDFDFSFVGVERTAVEDLERFLSQPVAGSGSLGDSSQSSDDGATTVKLPTLVPSVDASRLERKFLPKHKLRYFILENPASQSQRGIENATKGQRDGEKPFSPKSLDSPLGSVSDLQFDTKSLRGGREEPEDERGIDGLELDKRRELQGIAGVGVTEASPHVAVATSSFEQKSAGLWSAENFNADNLSMTPSRFDCKAWAQTPGAFTSEALLAAYNRKHPEFKRLPRKVKATGWYKYQGSIPGTDYSAPSARLRDSENTQPSADRGKALKASRKEPISQAEAGTSRAEMISRAQHRLRNHSSRNVESRTGTDYEKSDRETKLVLPASPVRRRRDGPRSRPRQNQFCCQVKESDHAVQQRRKNASMLGKSLRHHQRKNKLLGRGMGSSTGTSTQATSPRSGVRRARGLHDSQGACPGEPSSSIFEDDVSSLPMTMTNINSAFHLRDEVDVSDVLRAMLRLDEDSEKTHEASHSTKQESSFISRIGKRVASKERAVPTKEEKLGALSKVGTWAMKSGHCSGVMETNRKYMIIVGQSLESEEGIYRQPTWPHECHAIPRGRKIPGGKGFHETNVGLLQSRSTPGPIGREPLGGRAPTLSSKGSLSDLELIGASSIYTATPSSTLQPSHRQQLQLTTDSQSRLINDIRRIGGHTSSSTSAKCGRTNKRLQPRSPHNFTLQTSGTQIYGGARCSIKRNSSMGDIAEGRTRPLPRIKGAPFEELDSALNAVASDSSAFGECVSESEDTTSVEEMSIRIEDASRSDTGVMYPDWKDETHSKSMAAQPVPLCERSITIRAPIVVPRPSAGTFAEAMSRIPCDTKSEHVNEISTAERDSCSNSHEKTKKTSPGKKVGTNDRHDNENATIPSFGTADSIKPPEYLPERIEGTSIVAGVGNVNINSTVAHETTDGQPMSSSFITATARRTTKDSARDGPASAPLEFDNAQPPRTTSLTYIGGKESRTTSPHSKLLAASADLLGNVQTSELCRPLAAAVEIMETPNINEGINEGSGGEGEEAMLKRQRALSPKHEPTVKVEENWERQLVVPRVEDDLVNFETDTTAVRSKFERLRKFRS